MTKADKCLDADMNVPAIGTEFRIEWLFQI